MTTQLPSGTYHWKFGAETRPTLASIPLPRGHGRRRHGVLVVCAAVIGALVSVARPTACQAADRADQPTALFPMQLSYDGPRGAADLSGMLDRPAGRHGFIRPEGDRFVTDAGPIRFWGTNLCFDACFPEADQAPQLAERLARLGINCVRLHHMDMYSIWGETGGHTQIDPKQMARLDRLVHELKQRGIYVNINLHVSRWLDEKDGFPHRDKRPNFDKGLGQFEPRMIELQRAYARQLLTHVNPYTGNPYTHEPAVAMVEITNENGLVGVWRRGALDRLPEPYAGTFQRAWNDWLREKYGDTAQLRRAWSGGAVELGEELIGPAAGNGPDNRQRRQGQQRGDNDGPRWILESYGSAEARLQTGANGRRATLDIRRMGEEPWVPQLKISPFPVRRGKPYTLGFRISGRPAYTLRVNCGMDHPPWQTLGLDAEVDVSPQWSEQRLTFIATRDDPAARITFTSLRPGRLELADVSLRPGGVDALRPDERLENGSVGVLQRRRMDRTPAAREDFDQFLHDTERDFTLGMYRFLKDELGVKSPISGSQVGGWSPAEIQSQLDYVDAHGYWQHPRFPNRPWDRRDWYVQNLAMVRHWPGTLGRLIESRVEGKPYTVSEYNHPAPNQYRAEGFPMLAATAAVEGWDGVFSFAYAHNRELQRERITSFFDVLADPARLAHFPACGLLVLRTDDPGKITLQPPRDGREYFSAIAPGVRLLTGFATGQTVELGGVAVRIGPTRLGWATLSLARQDGAPLARPGRILVAATGVVRNTDGEPRSLGDKRITLGDRWGHPPVLCEGVPAEIALPVKADRVTLLPLDGTGHPRGEPIPARASRFGAVVELGPEHRTVWYEVRIE